MMWQCIFPEAWLPWCSYIYKPSSELTQDKTHLAKSAVKEKLVLNLVVD